MENITIEQAFNILAQVADAHLCNGADRRAIDASLQKIKELIMEKNGQNVSN